MLQDLIVGNSLPDVVVSGNWIKEYSDISPLTGNAVVLDVLGNMYCVGYIFEASFRKLVVFKLNPSGNVLWHKCLSVNGYESVGNTICLDNQGNVCIAGYTTYLSTDASRELYIAKIDFHQNLF